MDPGNHATSRDRQARALLRDWLRARGDSTRAMAIRAGIERDAWAWDDVRRLAEAERVVPLLHRAVGAIGMAPADLAHDLHRARCATALRNRRLLTEFGRAMNALAAAGVPIIVLKGVALAAAVYRDISLRPMADLDVLIRRSTLESAARVLAGLGYVPIRKETHPGALAEYESELAFRKYGEFPAEIDLHWSLFDSPYHQARTDMDWFWDTSVPLRIAGVDTWMLGPEALLLHLCGHLALHHAGAGLLWEHDIFEVLVESGAATDWKMLLSKVRAYDLVLPVRSVLSRAVDEWNAPVPAAALAALCALPYSPGEARVFASIRRPDRSAAQRFWDDLAGMAGWRQRLRFTRTNLLPSAAYMRQRYRIPHPLLLPLYYPYRWLRGLCGTR